MRESTNLTVAFNESRSATTYVMTITNSTTTKTVVTNTTTTTITGLSPGTMHDISVTAINSAGESGESGRLIDGRTSKILWFHYFISSFISCLISNQYFVCNIFIFYQFKEHS